MITLEEIGFNKAKIEENTVYTLEDKNSKITIFINPNGEFGITERFNNKIVVHTITLLEQEAISNAIKQIKGEEK